MVNINTIVAKANGAGQVQWAFAFNGLYTYDVGTDGANNIYIV